MPQNLTGAHASDLRSRVSWVEHQGVKILREDFRGLPEPDFLKVLDLVEAEMTDPQHQNIRSMVLVKGSRASKRVLDRIVEIKRLTKEKSAFTAVVGVTSVQKIILKSVNSIVSKKIMPFNSEGDALSFLASQRAS